MLVDKPALEGRGFEAWRILAPTYASSGRAYELDSMIALVTLHQCNSLHGLPGAVTKFERDIDAYERRTGGVFLAEVKAPAFLRMIPETHVSDMRWRFFSRNGRLRNAEVFDFDIASTSDSTESIIEAITTCKWIWSGGVRAMHGANGYRAPIQQTLQHITKDLQQE